MPLLHHPIHTKPFHAQPAGPPPSAPSCDKVALHPHDLLEELEEPLPVDDDRLPPDDFRLLDLHDRLASDDGPPRSESESHH